MRIRKEEHSNKAKHWREEETWKEAPLGEDEIEEREQRRETRGKWAKIFLEFVETVVDIVT